MTHNPPRALEVTTAALLAIGILLINFVVEALHQGEHQFLFGRIVVWSSRIATMLSLAAMVLVFRRPRISRYLILVSIIGCLPITLVTVRPETWCSFIVCSDSGTWEFAVLNWFGLLLLLPFLLAFALLARLSVR